MRLCLTPKKTLASHLEVTPDQDVAALEGSQKWWSDGMHGSWYYPCFDLPPSLVRVLYFVLIFHHCWREDGWWWHSCSSSLTAVQGKLCRRELKTVDLCGLSWLCGQGLWEMIIMQSADDCLSSAFSPHGEDLMPYKTNEYPLFLKCAALTLKKA